MSSYNPPAEPYILNGVQSQQLRSFCSNAVWQTSDLDDLAILIQTASLSGVRDYLERLMDTKGTDNIRHYFSHKGYGPGNISLFNFILQQRYLNPRDKDGLLSIARYLAIEVGINVDTPDLCGSTVLMYAISTKPFLDIEFAELMLEAGAEINHRNRYGCVAGHDAVMCNDISTDGKKKTVDAVSWFAEKGGDLDQPDGDGVTVRKIGKRLRKAIPELDEIFKEY